MNPSGNDTRRIGLVAPLPPQVGGVASFAAWLVEHERSIGCRYEPFDLWRPPEAEAGGRLQVAPALRQVRLLARFALWLRSAPDLVHVCVSYSSTGVLRDLVFVALARASRRRVIAHVHGADLTGSEHRVRALALRSIARLSVETVALAPSSRTALRRLGVEASVVFNPVRLEGPVDSGRTSGRCLPSTFRRHLRETERSGGAGRRGRRASARRSVDRARVCRQGGVPRRRGGAALARS